jgi:DNA modification methylase
MKLNLQDKKIGDVLLCAGKNGTCRKRIYILGKDGKGSLREQGMKPYYEQSGITIYHGDCREILPHLPPDSADLIVTDPPYGVEWVSSSKQLFATKIIGDESAVVGMEGLTLCVPILRRGRHVYAFGKWPLTELGMGGVCELIWDKMIPARPLSGAWVSQHDYISFGVNKRSDGSADDGNGVARLKRGSVLKYQRIHGDGVDRHPNEKPVALLRELIECSSRFDEIILDPFMGSGSTLEAAQKEGRRAIGIEADERWCEMAAKRLSQEVFQF